MANELVGRVESAPEIRVELAACGPPGPPGDTPYIGENGNWWIGDTDTGVPASGGGAASDHAYLTGRDKGDQHPVEAVTGLKSAIARIPPPVEALTNSELEELLT